MKDLWHLYKVIVKPHQHATQYIYLQNTKSINRKTNNHRTIKQKKREKTKTKTNRNRNRGRIVNEIANKSTTIRRKNIVIAI